MLTAEVEVDRGGDLAHLVLRFDFVEARIGLDDVVELEDHQVLVGSDRLYLEVGPRVLREQGVAPEPLYVRFRGGEQLALEDQLVAVVLLPQLRLLGEAGSEILRHPHR